VSILFRLRAWGGVDNRESGLVLTQGIEIRNYGLR
jgi:hypothetical protein